jgi:hypothetical protein
MKKKMLISVSILLFVIVGMIPIASALEIDMSWAPRWTGTDNANLNASQIAAIVSYVGPPALVEYYKAEVDGGVEGLLTYSYQTSFFNTPTDPTDARISYVSGPFITGDPIYLYVKGGNTNPAYYIFDISVWNGTETINLGGFWPNQGAISHVALLSTAASVPEPGTMLLLGIGLIGLAAGTRRFRK